MSDFKLAKRKISGTLDHVIGGAGSDIESTTARTEIIANALRPCKTSDEYVREIRKLWAEAQAKEEAGGEMRARERTGERWGDVGASWPNMA